MGAMTQGIVGGAMDPMMGMGSAFQTQPGQNPSPDSTYGPPKAQGGMAYGPPPEQGGAQFDGILPDSMKGGPNPMFGGPGAPDPMAGPAPMAGMGGGMSSGGKSSGAPGAPQIALPMLGAGGQQQMTPQMGGTQPMQTLPPTAPGPMTSPGQRPNQNPAYQLGTGYRGINAKDPYGYENTGAPMAQPGANDQFVRQQFAKGFGPGYIPGIQNKGPNFNGAGLSPGARPQPAGGQFNQLMPGAARPQPQMNPNFGGGLRSAPQNYRPPVGGPGAPRTQQQIAQTFKTGNAGLQYYR
jgi:hypothetical protein